MEEEAVSLGGSPSLPRICHGAWRSVGSVGALGFGWWPCCFSCVEMPDDDPAFPRYCPFASSFCGRLSSPECGLSFHFKCSIHMQIVNFKRSLIFFFSCMVCVFCALCKKFFSTLGDRNCLQIFFCRLQVLSFMGSSSSFSFLRITSVGTCTILLDLRFLFAFLVGL